jgi:hypothetical protein
VDEEVCGRHSSGVYILLRPRHQHCDLMMAKHGRNTAAINRITSQLCFWRTLLPSFNICKHNGDDEPEDVTFALFPWEICSFRQLVIEELKK